MPSPRNRSIRLLPDEEAALAASCRRLEDDDRLGPADFAPGGAWDGAVLLQDAFEALPRLPAGIAGLVVADPPYNLDKDFHGVGFRAMDIEDYATWLRGWLPELHRVLRPGGTLYLCAD
jgi:site-specific DNA-methyltransferase (adenine-specific)